MKVALVSDLHCGACNDSSIINNYFLRFYTEVFFPYLKDNNIDTVLILGDVFDRRKYCNIATLSSWRKNVFEVLNNEFKTHIILGNHDCYYKNINEVNSLNELFGIYKNINVMEVPTILNLNGTKIHMIPWVVKDEEENVKELLKNTSCDVVMGHFDIIGAEMDRGMTNKTNGFDPEVFSRFEFVLSGHYHHCSTIGNIHYLGSPYERTWIDYKDQKYFHILDLDKRELESIENPLRLFYKIKYDDTDKTYKDLLENKDLSLYKDCYVKIVIVNKTNEVLFDQFKEALEKENPADLSIVDNISDFDTDSDSIDETKDTLSLLLDYVDNLGLSADNKEPTQNLLREIYMESQKIEL